MIRRRFYRRGRETKKTFACPVNKILIFSEERLKFRRTMPFFVTFENERSVSELLFLFFSRKKKKRAIQIEYRKIYIKI